MHRILSWRKGVFLILGAMLLPLVAGCFGRPNAAHEEKNKTEEEKAVPVEVVELRRGPMEQVLRGTTYLEVEAETKVYARTSNRVIELLVEEGDRVEKGELLLRLENDVQKTQLLKAEVNLEKARQEFKRQKALYEQELISEQSFNNIEFELKQLELTLEDAQTQWDYTEVRAPITGTVTKRLVNIGALVKPNEHLFDLMNFETMIARVYLAEKYLSLMATNQAARVVPMALDAPAYRAYVKRISPVVETKNGTIKVTLGFEEVDRLRPGMYVETEIVVARDKQALRIPKRALLYDEEQMFVFRVLPDNRVEKRLVDAALMDEAFVKPKSGFEEGDLIVVAGQTGLREKTLIRRLNEPKPDENLTSVE